MAKAVKTAAVTRTTVVVDKPATITLELTAEEAVALAIVTAKIGGSSDSSLRRHTESVGNALHELGITGYDIKSGDWENIFQKNNASIYFTAGSLSNRFFLEEVMKVNK